MGMDREMLTKLSGEFAGTAMLMVLGCGGVATGFGVSRGWLDLNYNFAMAVMACVQVFIFVSGCQINPSVTIANCILGYMEPLTMVLYMIAQFLGAFFGMLILDVILPKNISTGLCVPVPLNGVTNMQMLYVELLLTYVLVLFCCALWDEHTGALFDSAPARLGYLILTLVLSGAQYTCAALNLARTLAPVVLEGHYQELPYYAIAHILAGILAPLSWKYIFVLAADADKSAD